MSVHSFSAAILIRPCENCTQGNRADAEIIFQLIREVAAKVREEIAVAKNEPSKGMKRTRHAARQRNESRGKGVRERERERERLRKRGKEGWRECV